MQNNNPLNKVVFIQKVAAFTTTDSITDLFRLAYINNSWNDTIKNYSFHLFEDRARNVGSADILEDVCECVMKCGVLWFVDVLMSAKTVLDRVNLSWLVCKSASFLEMAQLVFEKINEVGGKDLLKSQLTATDDDDRSTCLMHGCANFSSPEVMKLVLEKIVEVGGMNLLKSQLAATDDDGWTCLVHGCRFSESPEVMKLVFETIDEAGGPDLIKNQLTATDECGRNLLQHSSCINSSSRDFVKLLAAFLFHFDLFKQQYAKLIDEEKENLREKVDEIKDASWVPDPEVIDELEKIML